MISVVSLIDLARMFRNKYSISKLANLSISNFLNVQLSTSSVTILDISLLSASIVVNRILYSLTRNGLYLIFLPVDGNINS